MSSSLITCTNKGCYNQDYHKLDLDSYEVICSNCNKTVELSPYIKKIMKSGGQVFRRVETGVKHTCPHCKVSDTPVLLEYGKGALDVCCARCGGVNAHLTNYFAEPLRMNDTIPRMKVKVISTDDGDLVVQADGSALPWDAIDGQPTSVMTPAQTVVDEKQKRREDQRAAKLARIEGDRQREQQAMVAAQAQMLVEMQNQVKKKSSGRRAEPASAVSMLKRAGVSVAALEDDEEEESSRPAIKASKGGGAKSAPASAAAMLRRAGLKDLSDDEGEELNG